MGYTNPQKAIRDHVDTEDITVNELFTVNGTQGTLINESGVYSLALSSKLPSAKPFRRWITSEVIPSIRKTGSYALIPRDYPSALRALADAEEKRLALAAENENQRKTIEAFKPVQQYVDTILQSAGTLTTTQIAADYDITAQALNKILHEERIQRRVNGQWILYREHMGKGYTQSETVQITRSDGRPDTVLHTRWSQRGRLMIHEILTKRGIVPAMDRIA